MPRGFGRLGLVALVLAVLLLAARFAFRPAPDPVVGKSLPIALTPALPGRPQPGPTATPRLVNLFASWCVPCRAEAPVLAGLARGGVRIDGVAVRDEIAATRAFLARYGDPFARVHIDPKGRVQTALATSGLPETYVVDAGGVIIYRHRGNLQPSDAIDLQRRLAAVR